MGKGLSCISKENARIFTGNVRVFKEMHKNKFSEIGLASSKGLFYERPNQFNCGHPSHKQFQFADFLSTDFTLAWGRQLQTQSYQLYHIGSYINQFTAIA